VGGADFQYKTIEDDGWRLQSKNDAGLRQQPFLADIYKTAIIRIGFSYFDREKPLVKRIIEYFD